MYFSGKNGTKMSSITILFLILYEKTHLSLTIEVIWKLSIVLSHEKNIISKLFVFTEKTDNIFVWIICYVENLFLIKLRLQFFFLLLMDYKSWKL